MATHSSKIDPMAKVYLLVSLAFILAAVYYLVSSLFSTIDKNSISGEIDTDSLVANNSAMIQSVIAPIGSVTTSDGSGAVAAGPARSGEEVYTAVCQACHSTGAAGAPKIDDKGAWEPRVATGIEALMKNAINGKGAMPARGGQNVPDGELQAAIVYMTTKAGFNLKPKAVAKAAEKPKKKPEEKAASEEKAQDSNAGSKVGSETGTNKKAEKITTPKSGFSPAPDDVANEATENASAATPVEPKAVASEAAAPKAPVEPKAVAPVAAPTPPVEPKTVTSKAASTVPASAGISGEKIYKASCFACHEMGVAGAPKTGDKALWEPRIAAGKEALYNSAINGKQGSGGVMPPKGGNLSLSDDETKAAVDYMISQSQ